MIHVQNSIRVRDSFITARCEGIYTVDAAMARQWHGTLVSFWQASGKLSLASTSLAAIQAPPASTLLELPRDQSTLKDFKGCIHHF